MFRTVVIVIALATGFPACNGDDTGTIARGDRRINPSFDIVSYEVNNGVLVAHLNTENGARVVKLVAAERNMKMRATIEDNERQLFAITAEYDSTEDAIVFAEATASDSMWIKQTNMRDYVREEYVYNGDSLQVQYPHMDAAAMTASYDDYVARRYEKIDPDLLATLEAFEPFYKTDDSLHNNDEGKTLVHTIYALQALEGIGAYGCRNCVHYFCAGVSVLTGIKCLFLGGPANPGCEIGSIISLACAIFELSCLIWDWC